MRCPQVATNITGHCGYELPLWLHAVVTAGVGLTPLAATSKTHYIHHLDPRFNKVRSATATVPIPSALLCGNQHSAAGGVLDLFPFTQFLQGPCAGVTPRILYITCCGQILVCKLLG